MPALRATLRSIAFGLAATVASAWFLAFASIGPAPTGPMIGPASLPNCLAPGSPPKSGIAVFVSSCRYEWAPESNFDSGTHLGQLQTQWQRNADTFLPLGTHRWPAWAQLPDCTHAQTGLAPNQGLSIDARGLPFPALSCSTIVVHSGLAQPHGVRTGIPIARPSGAMDDSWIALPLKPIPLNFLLDTLFFAGLWGCGELLVAELRRSAREHRFNNRLCPQCAYNRADIPFTSPCPECGAPHSGHAPAPNPLRS